MEDDTPAVPQTPESTGLPADLFAKAQAAATEKGRPIYVYGAERAGRFTSKWEPVAGATPAAVIEPLPAEAPRTDAGPPQAAGGTPTTAAPSAAPDRSPDAPTAPQHGGGDRVTLHGAGGQTETWDGVTDVAVEEGGRLVRFRDASGAAVRIVVGGGSVIVTTPAAADHGSTAAKSPLR